MKSVQILFKKSGVVVEKWIIGGGTKVGSAVLQKTKQFTENINCEVHENVLDIEFTNEGIFCKTCGVKLKLIPEWIVGSKDSGAKSSLS